MTQEILIEFCYGRINSGSTTISLVVIYSCILGGLVVLIKPLNITAVLPDANFASSIDLDESPTAVLLTIEPFAFVDAAVLPLEDPLALSLVTDELPLVLLAVGPHQQSFTVHFILVPVTAVSLTVGPYVFAVARDLILEESSCVDASICKSQCTLSVFLSILVAAVIASAIRPGLYTLPMLLVLEPLTNVSGAICMTIGAMAVGLIVQPHALVHITIGVDEGAHSVGLIILPHAIVAGRVWPNLHSMAMFLSIETLASVCRAVHLCCDSTHVRNFVIRLISIRSTISRFNLLRELCAANCLLLRCHAVLDLELLPLLIDVGDVVILVSTFSLFLLDCDLTLVIRAV